MDLRSFLSYLKSEKRYSSHTIKAYETDLQQLQQFLLTTFETNDLLTVSHTHLRSWMVSLMEQGISARSINRKISSLKTFYRFEMRRGNIKVSPASKLVSPKVKKRLPVFVNEAQMGELFRQESGECEFSVVRNELVIELLYNTGMRVSELVGLKDSSIDRYAGNVKVLGKGNKERIIPMSKEMINSLKQYKELRNKMFDRNATDALLVTDAGKPVNSRYVYRIVNSTLGKFTTLDKKSPHVLRHTFATHLLNKGAEISAIKELLGHASLAATQVYTHNTIEKLKDIYKKAHPKA
ncbi:MAG: tyrosine-type recombinase/integrase [Chitinophagales bacterium]|nr:tyrosine-type recombinase/integrase [Chitinophagales bacterium]